MNSPRLKVKLTRDLFLFCFGVAGLAYEALSGGAEKPTLIIAFVGLLGLPLFIRGDESRRQDTTPPTPPVQPPPPPVVPVSEPAP